MTAVSKFLAGGVAIAALVGAAPAAAQYYPGTGYGSGGSGSVIGQVIDTVLGAQRYGYGAQGYANDRAMIDRCAVAVEQRINRDYGYRYGTPYGGGYGNYGAYGGQYGYNQYAQAGARVVGITRVERRSSNTTRVRGVATATAAAGYGAYGQQPYGGAYGAYGSPYGNTYGNNYGNSYGNSYAGAGELSFKCDIDYRGVIRDIDIDRNSNAYNYRRY